MLFNKAFLHTLLVSWAIRRLVFIHNKALSPIQLQAMSGTIGQPSSQQLFTEPCKIAIFFKCSLMMDCYVYFQLDYGWLLFRRNIFMIIKSDRMQVDDQFLKELNLMVSEKKSFSLNSIQLESCLINALKSSWYECLVLQKKWLFVTK